MYEDASNSVRPDKLSRAYGYPVIGQLFKGLLVRSLQQPSATVTDVSQLLQRLQLLLWRVTLVRSTLR